MYPTLPNVGLEHIFMELYIQILTSDIQEKVLCTNALWDLVFVQDKTQGVCCVCYFYSVSGFRINLMCRKKTHKVLEVRANFSSQICIVYYANFLINKHYHWENVEIVR